MINTTLNNDCHNDLGLYTDMIPPFQVEWEISAYTTFTGLIQFPYDNGGFISQALTEHIKETLN
jgi:hypothetical protein